MVRSIRFPLRDWRRLQRLAKRADRETSWLVRTAVEDYLERQDGGAA